MNLILKYLLIRRFSEQGFAVPMALALGLIMVLLSTISILKSNQEEVIAITQRQTAQALSAAEAGVARYRELINKNRNLGIYDSGSWESLPSGTPVCDDADTILDAVSDEWKNVDSSDPDLGDYRIVSYNYSGTDGADPDDTTFGTLTVEGQSNDSTASIEVQIPVRPYNPNDYLQPALWLGNSPTSIGSGTVVNNANIIVVDTSESGCPTPATPTSSNLQNQSTQIILADPRPLPSIPSLPATYNTVTSSALTSATQIPRAGDTADADNVYHYRITDALNVSSPNTLNINPGTKVILYVQGNSIIFNGDVTINAGSTSPYLEIYGSSATTSVQFTGNGTININALIHAPQATVTVSDSPTVNIDGAIWVSNWNVASRPITITADDTDDSPSYSFYTSKPDDESKPTVHAPTSWKTVEVN